MSDHVFNQINVLAGGVVYPVRSIGGTVQRIEEDAAKTCAGCSPTQVLKLAIKWKVALWRNANQLLPPDDIC